MVAATPNYMYTSTYGYICIQIYGTHVHPCRQNRDIEEEP